jgi:hypothetical protein
MAGLLAVVAAAPARAEVLIRIDKSAQLMTVTVDGAQRYTWPVSTGVASYDTPDGEFQPFRMEKDHFSREWDDAPMPFSIFFTQKGHAIHGTNHASIGRPASHGCVRLSVAHAGTLFALVKQEGMKSTKVVLTGEIPASGAGAIARRAPKAKPRYQDQYQDRYQDQYQDQYQNQYQGQTYGDDDTTGTLAAARPAPVYREPRYDNEDDRYYAPPRRYNGGGFPFGW